MTRDEMMAKWLETMQSAERVSLKLQQLRRQQATLKLAERALRLEARRLIRGVQPGSAPQPKLWNSPGSTAETEPQPLKILSASGDVSDAQTSGYTRRRGA